ncbi:MAG: hypothetical protein AMXMBFR84_12130 [Candidatus Hydrogenedentota bacterium]
MTLAVLFIALSAALPTVSETPPVALSHFPDRVHAFVWRNWTLVPVDRMAEVLQTSPANVVALGKAMGLPNQQAISEDLQRRTYITVIRRNWHLLPFDQMEILLGWTPEELAFTLREDDFLYVKLGLMKPKCEPLKYTEPDSATRERQATIAKTVSEVFPDGLAPDGEPLLAFIKDLSQPPAASESPVGESQFSPRYCYSYFALYGDPLLDHELDPYPDGYLARLAASGVDGVWLQAVLYKLAPFPWNPSLSDRYEERLRALKSLVEKCRKYGIGVYLYLNEPRAMPLPFYEAHPDFRGVVEGDYAALCTSAPEVRDYIRESIALISKSVPDLAGYFTISASENLTNCWSHHTGEGCPRCSLRPASDVISELHTTIQQGIVQAGAATRLIAWDWGWQDEWAVDAIHSLPQEAKLMSVSEWSIPITRGGIESVVGEYSISTIGPGPRATRHWAAARERGMKTLAKIQAGTTWEIGSVPYVPALENVARHAANLRDANVDGLMLGWTLGGYPSPNLEVVAEMGRNKSLIPTEAMRKVAIRRFGEVAGPAMVGAWRSMSRAFSEFPYNGATVYNAPQHVGPSNILWLEPTNYKATMVGIPYDDLNGWRGQFPPEVFADQFEKIADGFEVALKELDVALATVAKEIAPEHQAALRKERNIAETVAIHYQSVANQVRFVVARDELNAATREEEKSARRQSMIQLLEDEIRLARSEFALQTSDSRIGYEATNHYFFVPIDLVEKTINCRALLEQLQ